jgi:(2Fe-2S) ferredoxin
MTMQQQDTRPQFDLEGRFLGFLLKDSYKLKFLRLSTANGEYVVKISKEVRAELVKIHLMPGEWIQVSGYQKIDFKKGKIEFKAEEVRRAAPGTLQVVPPQCPPVATQVALMDAMTDVAIDVSTTHEAPCSSANPSPAHSRKGKPTILVCQKCKQGGRTLVAALESALSDRNLSDQVTVRSTGCMKQCKAGSNLVMPDKTRYSRISCREIPALVDKHFQQAHQAIAQ